MSLLAFARTGYDVYQQAALVLFVIAFVAVVIWACTRSREHIDDASRIPLDDQSKGMNHE